MSSKLIPEVWPLSEIGKAGVENEDAVLVYQPADPNEAHFSGSLYIVADGQGGGGRGQMLAQYAARRAMHAYFNNNEPDLGLRLRDALNDANADLMAYGQQRPELVKIGVSLVAAIMRGEQMHVASIGDCRAYLIREGAIRRITHDHTLVQQLLDEGAIHPDDAHDHPRKDVILRMLGSQEHPAIDVFDERLHPDDALVLATNGLGHVLEDEDIASIVANKVPRNAAELLAQKARSSNPAESITVVAALVRDGAPALVADVPYQWDGQRPAFDEQATIGMQPIDRASSAATTTASMDRTSQMATTTQVDRAALLGQTPPSAPPVQPPQPPPTQVAAPTLTQPMAPGTPPGGYTPPPMQAASMQAPQQTPAPGYTPPPGAYPPVPTGYTPPPGAYPPVPTGYTPPPGAYPPVPTGYTPPPGAYPPVPSGYTPPSGYAIDPVTGLPPVPQGPAAPAGWGTPPGYQQPRGYQPGVPAGYRQRRSGPTIGTFALVGAGAVVLVGLMVLVLINPFKWGLPSSGLSAFGQAPSATPTPPPPTPTVEIPPTVDPALLAPQATPTLPVPSGMISIDGEAFQRGVPDDEAQQVILSCIDEAVDNTRCLPDYFSDARPVEMVTISPFFIDTTEITNRAYAACVAAGACNPPQTSTFYNDPNFAEHPVVFVNYDQAGDYCKWQGKRLPTEAEWEMAARWDPVTKTSYIWPWGNGFEAGRANTLSAGQGGTSAVTAFEGDRSAYGVLGMAGNVTEWVSDWYFDGYTGFGTLNPTGPASQPLPQPFRVARGGSFKALAAYARGGQRFDVPPQTAADWIGFRCVQPNGAPIQPSASAPVPTATPTVGTPEAALTPTEGTGTPTRQP
jgi:formylglycine-generating enzyme required for sulfatase activity/serine/threonine protein phosphatase PrpC